MLLRSETRRGAELADMWLLPLAYEGPTPCNAIIILVNNGKTN